MNSIPKTFINKIEVGLIIFLLLSVIGTQDPPRFLAILQSAAYTLFPLWIVVHSWKRIVYLMAQDPFLWALILLTIASLFWTSNLAATSFDLRFLIRATILGFYLPIRYSPKDLIRLLTWTTTIAMILSVGFGLLFPAQSIQHGGTAWVGIFSHKQNVGSLMGMTATLFTIHCFNKQSNQWTAILGIGLVMTLVILADSKAGLVLCILPLLLMPLYKASKQGKYRGVVLTFALIGACILAATAILNIETIVVTWLGKDLAFNGRVPLWILSLEKGLEQPWLGYGYHGFWSSDASDIILFNTWLVVDPDFKARNVIANAHQGFLDLFLQLGAIGLSLFIASFSLAIKRLIHLVLVTRLIEYFWMLLFLVYLLVLNLVESGVLLEQGISWILYVSVSLSVALEHSRLGKTRSLSLPRSAISSAST